MTCPRSHRELVAGLREVKELSKPHRLVEPSSPQGDLQDNFSLGRGVERVRCHPALTALLASAGPLKEARHPLLQDPAQLGKGSSAGPGASRRGPPAGTCCSPGLARSPSTIDGPGLPPFSVRDLFPRAALRAATLPDPPSARYAPSRTRPARVRHYAIPRPGTQPHPANGPDWLSAPPA